MTIKLAVLSLALSILLGLIGATAKLSSSALLRVPAQIYTTLIRGIPDLVLMLLIFYSLQTWLTMLTDAMEWEYIEINPFGAGVITLASSMGPISPRRSEAQFCRCLAARSKRQPPTG